MLAYPEFALDAARQAGLLARYQALSEMVEAARVPAGLPNCSDPDDQKFLELAAAARAQGLVSKDRALLKLRRRCAPHFRIMTAAEAVRWLEDKRQVAKDLKVVDWKPKADKGGWFGLGFSSLAESLGAGAVAELLGRGSTIPALGPGLGLDGLVSVWHPQKTQ